MESIRPPVPTGTSRAKLWLHVPVAGEVARLPLRGVRSPAAVIGTACAVVTGACFAAALAFASAPETTQEYWLIESGPIELASGALYIVVGVIACGLAGFRFFQNTHGRSSRSDPLRPLLAGGCLLTMAAREFDWHKLWTARGVLKTQFYVDPEVPLLQKVAAVAVLTAIGAMAGTFVYREAGRAVRELKERRTAVRLAVVGICLLPLSKILDSAPGISRRRFGIEDAGVKRIATATEELLEFAIPVFFLASAVAVLVSLRATGASHRSGGLSDYAALRKAA